MDDVHFPASLLQDPGLSAIAKVSWAASQGHRCGLAPGTIRKGLAQLAAAGRPPATDRTVSIPAALLADRRIGPRAKLLYGLLQLTPAFFSRSAKVNLADLSELANAAGNTVRQAMNELVQAGWLKVSQENRKQPLQAVLLNPVLYRQRLELARAKRRILRAPFKGEQIMREILSALVDSDLFEDDAAPGFLANPNTGERLRFDRYYPPGVAFEYNGAQHYGTTDWFPDAEEAKEQHLRDLIKAGICFYRGITLVVVHAEDLSLEGVRRKIGNLLPLRDLKGHELLISYLERRSLQYRNRASPQE